LLITDLKRKMDMGLSNRVQAVLVSISAGLGAFGTAAAVIPDFVPVEYKVPIAVTSWLAGIVGFSIKEALGGQTPRIPRREQESEIYAVINFG
jgi:hypothetical protein